MILRTILVSVFFLHSRGQECNLPSQLVQEIKSYQPIVDVIVGAVINGPYAGRVFDELAEFVDTYGARLPGSENLEIAIDNAIERLSAAGMQVHAEPAPIPNWSRGQESLELQSPVPIKRFLNVIGLGLSPGTPPEGITAEVLVVKDFDELHKSASQVPGKIVLFNAVYTSYGETNQYRGRGPNEASKLGARAVLVRSTTPFSLNNPHTGFTLFEDGVQQIPGAAITLEDADVIARFAAYRKNITVTLKMGAAFGPDKISRNVIGDLPGREKPEEFVVVSGHIDSWDVGQGALDDAGGCFVSWHSVALINALCLPQTRRTLRAILWTTEELGSYGSRSYLKDHAEELTNWSAAFESDTGVFEATGLYFAGSDEATCIMQEIALLFGALNATTIVRTPIAGSDIAYLEGVPLGEAVNAPNNYFWYHHSAGDTMAALNTTYLDQHTALYAAVAYVLADLSIQLPRNQQTAQMLMDQINYIV